MNVVLLHICFDFIRILDDRGRQIYTAILSDQHVVLDADADSFILQI